MTLRHSPFPPLRVVEPRRRSASPVPTLREALVPFADAVPWPAIVVDDDGLVLYLNLPMQQRGLRLADMADRHFTALFPEYAAVLSGEPPWLTAQDAQVTRHGATGALHERVWVRRLPKGACLIVSDETQMRELQISQMQTARLASLGFMLASVSHEIGNPLAAIHAMLQILQSRRGVSPEVLTRGLGTISSSVRRLIAISRKLDSFSRTGEELPAVFAIDAAIEEAAALFSYDSLGETVGLVHHRQAQARLFGHVGQLQQVFYNLFLNAAQAMGGRGTIVVDVRCDGVKIEVHVRDTGPGLAVGDLHKVFEPFFTTKRNGESTGLGLAISQEIVQEHHGTLHAENHPEGGALFRLALPLHTEDPPCH
jgi:two-component system, NtrC family, sensor kinase